MRRHAWPGFEQAIRAQAEHCPGGVCAEPDELEKHNLLAPIAVSPKLKPLTVEDYIDDVRAVFFDRAAYEPRPALGYAGPDFTDLATRELRTAGKLFPVNQSKILFSHSGMKVPSEELFEEIYVDEILARLKKYGGFGRYE